MIPTDQVGYIAIAFPTNGDTALVAISMYHSYLLFASDGTGSVWPETARPYRILMKTSPPKLQFVGEVRDTVVFWIGLSEDGREKVMAAGRDSVVFGASGTSRLIQKCSVRWSRPNFSALPGQHFDDSTSARFVVQAQPSSPSPAQGCDVADDDGAGKIAPRIARRSHATMTAPLGPTRFTKSRRGTPALQPR